MPAKKKSAVADALTADRPRAARVMDVIANPDADALPVPLDLSAPLADDLAAIERKDPETLSAEIIQLQGMGNRCLLEIGKRLIAAKEKLSHGDWLPFLERVNISPRFAQRYMRLAREWTNATSLSYLGMSKALALLALPDPDDRDAFIAETHVVDGEAKSVDEMSVRELDAAIKARQEAEENLRISESKVSVLEARLQESERDAEAQRGELVRANQRLELANAETEKARAETQAELEKRIAATDELFRLKNQPVDVAVEKVVDEAAIEAARKEVREQMQSDLDFARADADTARKALETAKESAQKAIDKANAEAEKNAKAVGEASAAARQASLEAEKYRHELERAKSKQLANDWVLSFNFYFRQAQDNINHMAVALANIQDQSAKNAFKEAVLTLADAVRKAAE